MEEKRFGDLSLNQTEPNIEDLSLNLVDQDLPNNANNVKPWRELPFKVLKEIVSGTSNESEEDHNFRIHKFVTDYYKVFNRDEMEKKFPKFPDNFYDHLAIASQCKFEELVKQEKMSALCINGQTETETS